MRADLLSELMMMHRYCRPAGSDTEIAFTDRYVRSLPQAMTDDYGNVHIIVGDDTRTIFSCHTDTVHDREGLQRVELVWNHTLRAIDLQKHADRRRYPYAARVPDCLGADDTAGVFLCRQMILHGVPGHYIFHYGEELGCEGSGDLARFSPEMLYDAQIAIAFDRKDHGDIITHQCGYRTCSDAFATSLAQSIGGTYRPSAMGLYTDTRSYMNIIPECTNVSIGYSGAHGSAETLDVAHVLWLLDRLISIDYSTLVVDRNPVWASEPTQTTIVDMARWRDYTNVGNDATAYLDSWECCICSRVNHWHTEVCYTCGEERAAMEAMRAQMDRMMEDHRV